MQPESTSFVRPDPILPLVATDEDPTTKTATHEQIPSQITSDTIGLSDPFIDDEFEIRNASHELYDLLGFLTNHPEALHDNE